MSGEVRAINLTVKRIIEIQNECKQFDGYLLLQRFRRETQWVQKTENFERKMQLILQFDWFAYLYEAEDFSINFNEK